MNKISKEELADLLIKKLNNFLEYDTKAISHLVETRISCNEKMAGHPDIQVQVRDLDLPMVGFLGILNGLVGSIDESAKKGYGLISAVVEADGSVSKFERTK